MIVTLAPVVATLLVTIVSGPLGVFGSVKLFPGNKAVKFLLLSVGLISNNSLRDLHR